MKRHPQTDKRPYFSHLITRSGRVLLLAVILLAGCTPPAGVSLPPTATATAAATATPISAITPGPTRVPPTPTRLPTQTPVPQSTRTTGLCSPLADITLAELPEILTNPFEMPGPGRDDGHHGADYAYYSRGSHTRMLGLGVLSVLDGRTAAIIQDRPPYGNLIIIETPLENLPGEWPGILALPGPVPLAGFDGRVNCPPLPEPPSWVEGERSLYVLYAHLNAPPLGVVGDPVGCGDPIGEVGTTGASVNPHLHIEVRVGPAGAVFPALAHYTNDATQTEMAYYCIWRFSGLFQPVDPALLLNGDLK